MKGGGLVLAEKELRRIRSPLLRLSCKGNAVLSLSAHGKFSGKPSASLEKHCDSSFVRCAVSLACKAYGVLPFSKNLLQTSFP